MSKKHYGNPYIQWGGDKLAYDNYFCDGNNFRPMVEDGTDITKLPLDFWKYWYRYKRLTEVWEKAKQEAENE